MKTYLALVFSLICSQSILFGQNKLKDFPELAEAPNGADWVYLWDTSANTSKKNSITNFFKSLPAPGTTTLGGVKRNVGGTNKFVSGVDVDGSLLYGTPAGSGVAGIRIPFGDGTGNFTSDEGFEYNSSTNLLKVPTAISLGSAFNTVVDNLGRVQYYNVLSDESILLNLGVGGANTAFWTSVSGVNLFDFGSIDLKVPTEAYDSTGWDGDVTVPTKDAVRDKIEDILLGVTTLPSTYVGYGSGTNLVTGENTFTYNSATDTLRATNMSTDLISTDAINLYETSGSGSNTLRMYAGSDYSADRTLTWFGPDIDVEITVPNYGGFTLAGINVTQDWFLKQRWTASNTKIPAAMAALAVDLSKALNTKTVSGNVTVTFSNSLEEGQTSYFRIKNTGASEATVTLPASVYDANSGTLVSSISVPAQVSSTPGRREVIFGYDGSVVTIDENTIPDTINVDNVYVDSSVRIGASTDGISLTNTAADKLEVDALNSGNGFIFDMDTEDLIEVTSATSGADKFRFNLPVEIPIRAYDSSTWNSSQLAASEDAVRDVLITVGTTSAGTWASPITTNPYSPTWTTENFDLLYGATGTINLPAVSSYSGKTLFLTSTGTFTITVDPNGSEIIMENGASLGAGVADTISAVAGTLVGFTGKDGRWIKREAGGGGTGDAVLVGGNNFTGDQNVAGTVTATAFSGDGSTITNLSAEELDGVVPPLTHETITTADSNVITPTAGVSNVVVTGNGETTITLDATTETLTYDAQPATGTYFRYTLEGHSADCTVTIPSTYSFATGGLRTSFIAPANKPTSVVVRRDATRYVMWGDPEAPEVTFGGTAGTPNSSATVTVSFDASTYYHFSGATQELDLPSAVGYGGRGIVIRFDGSYVVTCDPNGSETIDLNGTATSAGEAIDITGTAGQIAVLMSDNVTWFVSGGSASYAEDVP